MKRFLHLPRTRALLLMLLLGSASFVQSQTTYLTVGCGYPNFTTLRAAFQWAESNYFPADLDISICPGTYNENAYINTTATTGAGHPIKVHSSTYNPADVTIHPKGPAQAQILYIKGVTHMEFDGITIEVLSPGTGLRRYAVRTINGAGDITFKNCRLDGVVPTGPGGIPNRFSIVEVHNLSGALKFFDTDLTEGLMGIHIASANTGTQFEFQNSGIYLVEGSGIRHDAPIDFTYINNSTLSLSGNGNWNGIATRFAPTNTAIITNTNVVTFGADRCEAIRAQAGTISLSGNQIRMAEHSKAYGIVLPGDANITEVTDNSVDYPGGMFTTIVPDSFMGIHRPEAGVSAAVYDRIRIEENEVDCSGAKEGMGINLDFGPEDLSTGLFVNQNDIHLENMGDPSAFWIGGIRLHGNTGCQLYGLEVNENKVYIEPLAGYISYGISTYSFKLEEESTYFTNTIEVAQAGTQVTSGLKFQAVRSATDKSLWVGNNAVALQATNTLQVADAIYLSFQVGENMILWHNSAHLYSLPVVNNPEQPSIPSPPLPNTNALYIWGYNLGGSLEMKDNIFSNTAGGLSFHNEYYTGNWAISNSNCYYTLSGVNLGLWGTTSIPNLTALQAVSPSSGDLYSVEMDPAFVAPNNLHLSNSSPLLAVNGLPLAFTGAAYPLNWDIDGEGRVSTNNREIGCDEWLDTQVIDPDWKTAPQIAIQAEVYPNPAQTKIHFQWQDHPEAQLQLLDQQGRIIREWNTRSGQALDIEFLPRGIYLLRAKAGNDIITKRVTLQ